MDARRDLPSVHALLEAEEAIPLIQRHGRALVRLAVQQTLDAEREHGGLNGATGRWSAVEARIDGLRRPPLRRVINATGVVLHTNLGRAPLAPAAAQAAAGIATGYSNLEFDLETGKRGRRHDLVSTLLSHLTGAEAAAVVNNCAAAVLLMLSALGKGREVIVSRGELVEIGGAFRMPDIMRLSQCRMVEVGTTNRTRLQDYAEAVTPKTAAVLKVHASNFRVVGFTENTPLDELTRLAHDRGLLMLHDLGSGALVRPGIPGLEPEPVVQDSLAAGVDVVACSGDKLLGGPQAGLLLGRQELIDRALKHPLARAMRVDKMTLAALWATLDLYLQDPREMVPVWQMLTQPPEAVRQRAEEWQTRLRREGVPAELATGTSAAGGGSLPGQEIATTVLLLSSSRHRALKLVERLRAQDPPVIARVQDDRVAIDPRTVQDGEAEDLLRAVVAACR
jgi:L-seryl-tRNA(Ser) seleniumtransferase